MMKQRLFKMTDIARNMLVKALFDIRQDIGTGTGEVENLIERTVHAPGHLYLNEADFHWTAVSLNSLRSAYLSAGRSSGGIDKVLCKLMNTKYRRVPVR